MNHLEFQYEEMEKVYAKNEELIAGLLKNEKVQEYRRLMRLRKQYKEKMQEVYKKMKFREYTTCSHVLIKTKVEEGKREGRKATRCGCIICGLNEAALDVENPTYEETVMVEYLKSIRPRVLAGLELDITCNLPIAEGIYASVKENNPDVPNEEIINLFKIALVSGYIEEETPKVKTKDEDFDK